MGRRELQGAMADRALWSDAALCGCRLLHSYEGTDRASRSLLTAGDLHRKRSKGPRQRHHLCDRDSARFRLAQAAYGCYVFVAVMWLVPDRRIEKQGRE